VRRLYRQVKKKLQVTSAMKLVMEVGTTRKEILRSDEKMNAAGISNRCELFVIVLQEPDIFKVLLNLPNPIGSKTINIAEVL